MAALRPLMPMTLPPGWVQGSAQIDAGHGRTRSEAVGPHVRRQALSLENVATGEAYFLLDVGRPQNLGVDDG